MITAKLTSQQRNQIARALIEEQTPYCDDFIAAKRHQARKYGVTVEHIQEIYEAYHARRFDRIVAMKRAEAADRRAQARAAR